MTFTLEVKLGWDPTVKPLIVFFKNRKGVLPLLVGALKMFTKNGGVA